MTVVFDRMASVELVAAARAVRARRLADEAARLDAIKAGAAVPDICGPRIVAAPARGGFVVEHQVTMVPNGVDAHGLDKWAAALTGYGHRANVRGTDVFDRMIAQALRRKRAPALTPGQMAIGRRYRDLVEALSADGCSLSSLEGSSGGSGDDGGWMDHRLQMADERDRLRRRIGNGCAMPIRRVRPSDRGPNPRGPIMDRVLVDMVCLSDKSLDDVLRAHGWQRDGRTRKAIAQALSAALDRMIGYRIKKSS